FLIKLVNYFDVNNGVSPYSGHRRGPAFYKTGIAENIAGRDSMDLVDRIRDLSNANPGRAATQSISVPETNLPTLIHESKLLSDPSLFPAHFEGADALIGTGDRKELGILLDDPKSAFAGEKFLRDKLPSAVPNIPQENLIDKLLDDAKSLSFHKFFRTKNEELNKAIDEEHNRLWSRQTTSLKQICSKYDGSCNNCVSSPMVILIFLIQCFFCNENKKCLTNQNLFP
ncbi:hypothetical protein HZS_3581, partial [Henneguya salminicola]